MMRQFSVPRLRASLPAAIVVLFVLPSVVMAHAELEQATPRDGATVEGTPTEISGTYTQDLDPDGTSLMLVDPSGDVISEGVIDPDNDRRMFIAEIPELAPGEYTVRSTTLSAEDDELDREEWTFTVELAPTPSPSPTPTPTPAPSATPVPTPTPAPSASPTPSASPAASADGGTTGSGGDVLLPIIAAVVVVGVIAGYLFSRRDRTPTQP